MSNQDTKLNTTTATPRAHHLSAYACQRARKQPARGSESVWPTILSSILMSRVCARHPCSRWSVLMKLRTALLILAATAVFTPFAAAMGLYESTLDDAARLGAPMLGAGLALTLRHLSRRAGTRRR